MASTAPIPSELTSWLSSRMPGLNGTTDASWPRDTSRVWCLTAGSDSAFVKISPTRDHFDREVHAYRHSVAALPAGAAPRLLASDPLQLAILTSGVPGAVVRDSRFAEDTEVHHRAGELLRLWHEHPTTQPAEARQDAAASMAAQADEAAACLTTLVGQLAEPEQQLVREAAQDLPRLSEGLPLVYLHGDASPRNWLWDQGGSALALIDFENAGHGLAVQDMIWLRGALWSARPDLRNAFLAGYGRPLKPDEDRALLLLTSRLAVSYLNTGVGNNDQVLITRGRTVLRDLARTGA